MPPKLSKEHAEFLKNAVVISIPQKAWIKKNKITLLWQDIDRVIYSYQINAREHYQNLWKVAQAIHRVRIMKKLRKKNLR